MRPAPRYSYFAALAAFLAFACAGCAAMRPSSPAPAARPLPLSAGAEVTYDYLRYQALFQEMTSANAAAVTSNSPQALARMLKLQKAAAGALDAVLAKRDSPSLYMDKAFLYWNEEQAGEARRILSAGLAKHPDDYNLNAALANACLLDRDAPAAVHVIESYLARHESVSLRGRLGQLLIDSGQPARGLAVLRRIPAADRSPETRYQMARGEAKLGRHREAVAILEKVTAENPESLEALVELAFQQELIQDYAAAVATYSHILALGDTREDIRQRIENGGGEGHEDIRLRVVGLYLKLNNPDKALDVALKSAGNKSFVLAASLLFLKEHYTAQASTLLDVLATHSPVPSEYFFYKAVIAHDGEGNSKRALQFLELVPKGDPHYSQALQFRIQLLYALGREEEALGLIDEGARLFPNDARFPLLRASYLIEKKRLPEAKELLKKAVAAHPDDEDLLYQYGAVLDRAGDRKAALDIMERIIGKDPEYADALNFIGYTLVDENRDLPRALELIRKADGLKPGNGYIVDSLAWAYFRMGRLEDAWREIRRAVELNAEDSTMWEHYGDIAAGLGKRGLARRAYRKALKFKPDDPAEIERKLGKQ